MNQSNDFDVRQISLNSAAMIEASAGTGKTYSLIILVIRLILEKNLKLAEILIVTFTDAATFELRTRLHERLQEAIDHYDGQPSGDSVFEEVLNRGDANDNRKAIFAALNRFEEAAIYTIHGFCQQSLQNFDPSGGEKKSIDERVEEVLASAAHDSWVRYISLLSEAQFSTFSEFCGEFDAYLGGLKHYIESGGSLEIPSSGYLDAPNWQELESRFNRLNDSFDIEELQTIHCFEGLNRTSYKLDKLPTIELLSGLTHWDVQTAKKYSTSELLNKLKKNSAPPANIPKFSEELERYIAYLNENRDKYRRWSEALTEKLLSFGKSLYGARKEALDIQGFQDLILDLWQHLSGPRGATIRSKIRSEYQAALIDEYQDTDPLQFRIFSECFPVHEKRPLFLIGDPKQSIYAFRGADIESYLSARDALPADRRFTMQNNFRSCASMVSGVNEFFRHNESPFAHDSIAYYDVNAAHPNRLFNQSGESVAGLELWPYETLANKRTGDPAELAFSAIRQLLSSSYTIGHGEKRRAVRIDDIAILCRSNNSGFAIQRRLLSEGFPAIFSSDKNIYEQTETDEYLAIFKAITKPRELRNLATALGTHLLGISATHLERLQHDETELETTMLRFESYGKIFSHDGLLPMLRQLDIDYNIRRRILSQLGGERIWTNFEQLGSLLSSHSSKTKCTIESLHDYLAQRRDEIKPKISKSEEILMLESDDPAISITTIHKSKGLEYPIVILPDFDNNSSSNKGSNWLTERTGKGTLSLVYKGSPSRSEAEENQNLATVQEALRVGYVALTRAKHLCIVPITSSDKPPSKGKSSEYTGTTLRKLLQDSLKRASSTVVDGIRVRNFLIDENNHSEKLSLNSACLVPQENSFEHWHCPPLELHLLNSTKSTSFSGLSYQAYQGAQETQLSYAARPGKDESSTPIESTISINEELLWGVNDSQELLESEILLKDFPKGPEVGTFVHSVFETHDFATISDGKLNLEPLLVQHGLSLEDEMQTLLSQALQEAVYAPILKDGSGLKSISSESKFDEIEFLIPMGSHSNDSNSPTPSPIFPFDLAEVFRRNSSEYCPDSYAKQVAQLSFTPSQGFLKGFIDLVFCHEGIWYLADYKTNYLGQHHSDYDASHLHESMTHHHYYLQYHLYTVALVRILQKQNPNFDYEKDFGGVFYLFLRGMNRTSAHSGIFFDKPTLARVTELSELFQP